jgi:hypothetical protein
MFAPCVGDVLRAAARPPTKNSAQPRQKNFNPGLIFSMRWILESKKNEGGLAEKTASKWQTKK